MPPRVSDDQGSDVSSMRLGDVRLDQHGFADGEKTLHEIARLVERMTQEDALTLGTGIHFDDHREAPHGIDGLIDIEDITNIHRRWDVDSIPCEDLARTQLVPAPEDPLTAVRCVHPTLLEGAEHGCAVARDGMTDPWDHSIDIQWRAIVVDRTAVTSDPDAELYGIIDLDVDVLRLCLLDQSSSRIEPWASG